jgi:hypothetical protein
MTDFEISGGRFPIPAFMPPYIEIDPKCASKEFDDLRAKFMNAFGQYVGNFSYNSFVSNLDQKQDGKKCCNDATPECKACK